MSDHLLGHLVWIDLEIPLAAVDLFQTVEQVIGQDVGAGGGPGDAEQGVDPGGDKVLADGDGLLTHPLGGGAGRRQVANIVAQAAGLDAGGGGHQDPGVVHAGAHVQHRRDTYGLADLGQAGAAELRGRFRGQQTGLTAGHGRTAGGQDDDVIFQQLFDQGQMGAVMGAAAVVAADHAGHAPHPAVDDVVIQGVVGTADGAAQQILNGLIAETHHRGGLAGRNHHRGFAVGEVVDGLPHYLPGHIQGMMFIKGDVHGGPFDHGPVVRSDELGVITFGNIGQGLHLALHVHHHGVHGAGDDGQFLLQVVARHRNAVAHQDLVGAAAHAGQLDALGALVLGILDHLRFLGGHIDHLRQQGLMAVHDDVDVIFFQDAQVDLTGHRHRHAEQDVLQVGGDHGAAPAVGQGASGCTA